MKKLFIVSSIMLSVAAMAANKYSTLAGTWEGQVEKNVKEVAAGGKPNMEVEKTPVKIQLAEKADTLEGTSLVGKDSENWTFDAKAGTYTWADAEMTVTAKATDLPDWAKTEVTTKPTDKVFAFKYDSCTLKADKKKCEVKKHIPEGMDTTGHWVFVVGEKGELATSVVYKYPSGKIRHLAEKLAKK